MKYTVQNIFTGPVKQVFGMTSAIDKKSVEGALYLSFTGLDKDECAEEKFHGGSERALHQYPSEHYDYWRLIYGDAPNWRPSGMGENITATGMTEKNIYIGQRFQWGEAVIEVSQPRSPCFKVSKRWGVEGLALAMQTTGRCGWLYRVIQPGMVKAHDPLVSLGVDDDAVSVHEVLNIFFNDPLNTQQLERIATHQSLADEWTVPARKRLESGSVEHWTSRLFERTK